MEPISFSGLLIVSAVAFAAPLVIGLSPSLRLPAIVLEIVLGDQRRPVRPGLGRRSMRQSR